MEGGLNRINFEGQLAGSVAGEVGFYGASVHEREARGESLRYGVLYSRVPRVKMRTEEKKAPRFRRMETFSAASRAWERPRGWAARDLGDMLVVCLGRMHLLIDTSVGGQRLFGAVFGEFHILEGSYLRSDTY